MLDSYSNKNYILCLKITNNILLNDKNNIIALKIKAACLKTLGRFEEALSTYVLMLKFDTQIPELYYNIGNLYREAGNLKMAAQKYKESIDKNPNFLQAYAALSVIHLENNNLQEAKNFCTQGLLISNNSFDLHYAMSILYFYECLYEESINELTIALKISNGTSIEAGIALAIVKRIDSLKKRNLIDKSINIKNFNKKYERNFSQEQLTVKERYLDTVYKSDNTLLKNLPDARFGEGICTPNFRLFELNCTIIKEMRDELSKLMINCVNSEIILLDSFCNIFFGKSGTTPHHHLKSFDNYFDMGLRKFSLVWYLNVGDQNSLDPGILKLFEPEISILPKNGDVIIIPSNRKHSSSYSGDSKRVMVGVNFYSLPSC